MNRVYKIFFSAAPVLIMIGLIPLISDDYILLFVYLCIIASLIFRREKNDIMIFIFGFFIMIVFEYFFIRTGVEIFSRRSLLGVMPIWLPILWAYGFVAIKRSIEILNSDMTVASERLEQRRKERKEKIMELFQDHENISNEDVEKLLKVSDATATRYLEELEDEGKIEQHHETGRGVFYTSKTAQMAI